MIQEQNTKQKYGDKSLYLYINRGIILSRKNNYIKVKRRSKLIQEHILKVLFNEKDRTFITSELFPLVKQSYDEDVYNKVKSYKNEKEINDNNLMFLFNKDIKTNKLKLKALEYSIFRSAVRDLTLRFIDLRTRDSKSEGSIRRYNLIKINSKGEALYIEILKKQNETTNSNTN